MRWEHRHKNRRRPLSLALELLDGSPSLGPSPAATRPRRWPRRPQPADLPIQADKAPSERDVTRGKPRLPRCGSVDGQARRRLLEARRHGRSPNSARRSTTPRRLAHRHPNAKARRRFRAEAKLLSHFAKERFCSLTANATTPATRKSSDRLFGVAMTERLVCAGQRHQPGDHGGRPRTPVRSQQRVVNRDE